MHDGTEPIGVGLRLLIVDDEPVVREFLGLMLSELGFEIELLSSLAEARQRTSTHEGDILLIDQRLDDGNGLELCRELTLRADPVRIIMMSGHASLGSALEAMRYGANDFIVKPVETQDLCQRVARVARLARDDRRNRTLVEELRLRNAELEALSVRDPLTRLFNHAYLQEALQREIGRSERHGHNFAIALLDIDGFREINAQHGHSLGDRILRDVASVLRVRSRRSDLPFRIAEQEVVARYGPDVFALILPEASRASAAAKLQALRGSVAELTFEEVPAVNLSAGFACFPEDGHEREVLLACAQRALSAAKRVGGNQLISYSSAIGMSDEDSAALAATRAKGLHRVLADVAFKFVYQPIVNVRERSVFGYEALCRPLDPAFGHVLELIETAVRTGRIAELGRALRQVAIAPMVSLPEQHSLFLNIHPQDLNDDGLIAAETYLTPWKDRIVLEVTETEAISDPARARERIKGLRTYGFRVALDDLGAGYSSLNLLAQLEPDFVKLDMELVRGIERETRAARLMKHLLEFCRGEGFTTIAEGIETEAELRVVTELGVDCVQGFLLGRPAPLG